MKPTNFTQNTKRAMKHFSFFIFLFSFAFALASCNKSEEAPNLPQSGDQSVTFAIVTPTRATVADLSRYIMEAYEGKDLATTPQRVEAATGSLTLELKKNTEYTFVFWADNGTVAATDNYYDATSLQDVKVNPAAYAATVATPAYCLTVSFNTKDFEANKAVTLKNATAQLNFVEAAGLTAAGNSLTVKYSSGGKLNVATGAITEIGQEISRTYSNIAQTAKDGIVATDYILAPLDEKRLLDLKMTFNAEPEKIIAGVPLQQSYKTNIKGEFSNLYSSTFTISNEVADYENDDVDVEKIAKVGDFFYSDNTFSTTLDATKTCIGIVYEVNADGKTGKIVGLTETTALWSTEYINTGATSDTDGAANTSAVFGLGSYSGTTYPAFKWCADLNTSAPSGISWYIPAKDELLALYGTKAVVNTSLTAAGATQLSNDFYWSSTQYNALAAWYVYFSNGNAAGDYKDNDYSVRVVSAF